jgi:hypothetical protein
MLDLKALDIEGNPREAIWIGDPAVDLGASDLARWRAEGKGLILKPTEKASVIKWRPLGPYERFAASVASGLRKTTSGDLDLESLVIYHRQCARLGIVSIEGVRLERTEDLGVRLLTNETMLLLDKITIPDPAPPELEGFAGERLVTWIGGIIALSSFRDPD